MQKKIKYPLEEKNISELVLSEEYWQKHKRNKNNS